MTLNRRQETLCETSRWDFSDLRAVFLSCTLKRSPERSHTEGLMALSRAILEKNGVSTELIRVVDHDVASGVWPDLPEPCQAVARVRWVRDLAQGSEIPCGMGLEFMELDGGVRSRIETFIAHREPIFYED
jgi:hypothetical protein